MKYILLIIILALIFISALLVSDLQKQCENSNGKWIHTRDAGINNEKYECVK